MPELPEVEVVRRGLVEAVSDRIVDRVEVLHPRPVRHHLAGPEDFADRLVGERFTGASRRGKYLWLPLSSGDAILAHLGMSGQFRVDDPDTAAPVEHRHVRVRFGLSGGRVLSFCDQRMFGGLRISPGGAELPAEVAHIARDPFDPEYDLDEVVRRMRRKRTTVKRALLDQTLVSGIGNIYADEALWRARLHGDRATDTLARTKAYELLGHVRDVMAEALAQGGTSFDALYVNVNGESGYFERGLDAYGREGLPCRRCGRAMVREQFANRSSTRCPSCQRRPRQG
ncbi:MAG TPA: bifunctional DNA-formamidopyrimidine glycosylase/DNA-(apurinic or apyrimidinic site) lyase [Candidatus Avipropionibacterium avicola]|uniref:Formamidopyrimidine-DNA glycosylase n=1 Tax=Candidatus Avipropionibacterium avicola TaxID=2840701 RepID=A0A9D1GWY0_9ACTN|nr:bifunctional DNA-formamidopyrimidine glycosylase/DNA-(apurinic or apyrimidinic site) lyase [Candidatus Avipropionibacterium avicola]